MKQILSFFFLLGVYSCVSPEQNRPQGTDMPRDTIIVELINIPPRAQELYVNGKTIPTENPALAYWENDQGEIMHYPNHGRSADTLIIPTTQDTLNLFLGLWGWSSEGLIYPLRKGQTYQFRFAGRIAYPIDSEISHFGAFYGRFYRDALVDSIPSTMRLRYPRLLPLPGAIVPEIGQDKLPIPYLSQAQKEINFLLQHVEESVMDSALKYSRILQQYAINYASILKEVAPTLQFKNSSPLDIWAYQLERETNRLARLGIYERDQSSVESYLQHLKKEGVTKKNSRRLLSSLLWRLSEEASPTIFEREAVIYKGMYPNTTLVDHLFKHYVDTTKYQVSEVYLMDIHGQTKHLSNLLNEYRGDSIVLDIWATWCAPCLEDIRLTQHRRKKQGQKEDVHYIFLAFQDDKVAWRSRVKDLKLDQESDSYFVLNSDAKWFQTNKINSLPAKVFFSKSGEITKTKIGI